MARHRIHSLAFKKRVVQEYAAGATLNGLAREHDLSRNLIRIWIAKSESGELDPDVEAATLLGDYEAKIATLERMVGRQALEIEFFANGALQQGRSPRIAVAPGCRIRDQPLDRCPSHHRRPERRCPLPGPSRGLRAS